eukprot:COSAG02_NODE_1742_length_11105_cov_11.079956_4_plen_45_part_00
MRTACLVVGDTASFCLFFGGLAVFLWVSNERDSPFLFLKNVKKF